MAEVVATVGLIASVASIIDVSAKITSRLYEFNTKTSDVPKSLQALQNRLPLLSRTLESISGYAKAGKIEDEVAQDLRTLIDSVLIEAEFLRVRIDRIIPLDGSSKFERTLKVFKSVAQDSKVNQAVEKIHRGIDLIVLHQTTGLVEREDRILKQLFKLTSNPSPYLSQATQAPFKTVFTVPYTRDRHFIPRQSIFKQIEELSLQEKPVVLCGLGGIGKSQVAIEYAYRFRKSHRSHYVFWINASTIDSISQTFSDLARRLQLPGHDDPKAETCQLVSNWFEEDEQNGSPRQWLLVVDNIDSLSVLDEPLIRCNNPADIAGYQARKTLLDYLPRSCQPARIVLATTRNQDVASILGEEEWISVKAFTPQESQKLLDNKMGFGNFQKHNLPNAGDFTLGKSDLLEKLGHIPLAITQAAAFMKRNQTSVSHYRQMLERDDQNQADHLSTELQDVRRQKGWPNSIFRTWKMSFEEIKRRDPLAMELMSLAAIFDGQQIPKWLLVSAVNSNEAQIASSMGTLFGYALITQNVSSGTISVHPLLQASVRFSLRQDGVATTYVLKALDVLSELIPKWRNPDWEKSEILMPHIESALNHPEANDTPEQAQILHYRAIYRSSRGLYNQAWADVNKAYDIRARILEVDASDTIDSLNFLGWVTAELGQYPQGEEILRQALAARIRVLGEEHPSTLITMNHLVMVLKHQDELDEAEASCRAIVKARRKVFGDDHIDTVTSLEVLGVILVDQDELKEAEEIFRETLMIRQKVQSLNAIEILSNKAYLASTLGKQDKNEEADVIFQEVIAESEKAFGSDCPTALGILNLAAENLETMGKYQEAEEVLRRTLVASEKNLGNEHPFTLSIAWNLGHLLYVADSNQDESRVLCQRTLTGYEKLFGPDNDQAKFCREHFEEHFGALSIEKEQ